MLTNISRPSVVDVQQPFTAGDLFVADTANTVAKLPDVAVGNALLSGGIGAAPAYGKVAMSTAISGILPSVNGGTGVANAGTITNASNFTLTGGGTIALGGFTLTVPATGTADLLGTAQTISALKTLIGGLTVTTTDVILTDVNVVVSSVTGTKFGTSTAQKIAFYNSTPVAQQTGDVLTALATGKLGLIASPTISATTLTGVVPSANGGTGVNNAGTITNASNTTITGGGTLALGGFTLTVPATDTAALLGQTQTITGAKTFSAVLAATSATVGSNGGGALTVPNGGAFVGGSTYCPDYRVTGTSGNGFRLTAQSGYGFVALNADTTFSGTCGFFGGASGDNNLYLLAPTGFAIQSRVNNSTVFQSAGALNTSLQPFTVTDTTDSTSISSGSTTISGGLGVSKRICLDGSTGKTLRITNSVAPAAVAVTLGLGPTGSTAGTPQGWMRIDIAGTDRYIPFW